MSVKYTLRQEKKVAKFNTAYVRKIVRDNDLDITVKGRSNGIISLNPANYNDLATMQELLKGMGYKTLFQPFNKSYVIYKIADLRQENN